MWYNDLLIILLGFVALLMIVLTIIMASRMGKPKTVVTVEEKPEKVYVEKGFEAHEPEPEPDEELDAFYEEPEQIELEYIEPVIVEPELVIEETVYIESIEEPEEPFDDVVITPIEPIIIEPVEEESDLPDENVAIISTESILIEPIENVLTPDEEQFPEDYSEPATIELEAKPEYISEPFEPPELELSEEVLITPTETFFDPLPEESEEETPPNMVEIPNELEEPIEYEAESQIPEEYLEIDSVQIDEIDELPEIELPPLEPDEPEKIEDEIEPEPEEEPIPEPVVKEKPKSRRMRKPVIDESDPDLKVDLGIVSCPHCGSKVPDTIYCILCGKPLDMNNAIGYEEEKEET